MVAVVLLISKIRLKLERNFRMYQKAGRSGLCIHLSLSNWEAVASEKMAHFFQSNFQNQNQFPVRDTTVRFQPTVTHAKHPEYATLLTYKNKIVQIIV